MKDFAITIYKQLLQSIRESGYSFVTFEGWCDGKTQGHYVILRHDVDLKASNSLIMAQVEAELNIRATYYFRVIPESNQPEIIKAIAELGHEIGYHYEDLSLHNGEMEKAFDHFKQQLSYFRQFYPVRTICMHGSPFSKWDNRDLWKKYDYKNLGIIGEPYMDFLNRNDVLYFTDTGRMWNGDKFNVRDKQKVVSNESSVEESLNHKSLLTTPHSSPSTKIHSTFDLINWIKLNSPQNIIMINTHPQRWTNKWWEWLWELISQNIKNLIKGWFILRSKL